MNGYADNNNPGGGFAAEAAPGCEGDVAAKDVGAAMASSGREKTSVVVPMRITGGGILSDDHDAFEMGWNLCLQFIRWDNPNIEFEEWTYKP